MDINSTTNIGPNNPFCYSDISTFASSDCGAIKDQFGSLINNLDNGSPSQTLNLTLAFYCNLSAIFYNDIACKITIYCKSMSAAIERDHTFSALLYFCAVA